MHKLHLSFRGPSELPRRLHLPSYLCLPLYVMLTAAFLSWVEGHFQCCNSSVDVLILDMQSGGFVFTGIVIREGKRFTALCPELDVASEGDTEKEASGNLLEAVNLYLETAIESNLPYLRPVPADEDPRRATPDAIERIFKLNVEGE